MPRADRRAPLALMVAIAVSAVDAPVRSARQPGAPASASQAQSAVSGAAISGTVVDAATNKPLAGAIVTTGPKFVDQQLTDNAGRFLFANLPPQSYALRAVRPGYFDGAFGMDSSQGTPRSIALASGQWMSDVIIKLWRPSAISGTVVDESGEPIVGVYVSVVPRILIAGEAQLVAGPMTKTDDRGLYRVGLLTPGAYGVVVHSIQVAVPAETSVADRSNTTADDIARARAAGQAVPLRLDALAVDGANHLVLGSEHLVPPTSRADGQPQAYPPTYYPAARSVADAVTVDLASGEERTGVDVQLRPLPVRRVSGIVHASPGTARPRVLRMMPAGSEHMGAGHETAVALVGRDGAFTFLNVPDGSYTILAGPATTSYTYGPFDSPFASAMSFGSVLLSSGVSMRAVPSAPRGTYLLTLSSAEKGATGRTSVEVTGADRTGVALRVGGVSISGRFVLDRSPDSSKRPFAYWDLFAEPAGGEANLSEARGRVEMNDPTLSFTIQGLEPGEYVFRLSGAGGIIKSIVWNGKDYTNSPFPVTPDQDVTGLVVTSTTQVARVQGIVRDAQGRPATRAAVLCFPTEPAEWRRYGARPTRLRSVPASTAGGYEIPTMPAGDYYVLAVEESLADRWKDAAFLEAVAARATRVSLDWGETRTQDLIVAAIKP